MGDLTRAERGVLAALDFRPTCDMRTCSRPARRVLRHPTKRAHALCRECAVRIRAVVRTIDPATQRAYCGICDTPDLKPRTIVFGIL